MARFQINPGVTGDGVIEFEMTADDGSSTVKTRLTAEEAQGLVDLLAQVRMMTPGSIAEEPAEGVVSASTNGPIPCSKVRKAISATGSTSRNSR